MKRFKGFVKKEFYHIFRDKRSLFILFGMPIAQILLFGFAITNEINNVDIAILDYAKDAESEKIIQKIKASKYFNIENQIDNEKAIESEFKNGKIKAVLLFERDFAKKLENQKKATVQVITDATEPNVANTITNYTQSIIQNYQNQKNTTQEQSVSIVMQTRMLYNAELKSVFNFVPGVMTVILMLVSAMMTSISITREKELGTLEQINVTPIKKYQFIIGKLFPFWVLGLIILSVGLVISKVVFNVPMLGSILLVYGFTSIYLLLILGFGLYISNHTETQQQAMFIAWFFMVIFILMSGLFTPIESMPKWAQNITLLNPIRYFVEFIRMVLLKGAGLKEVLPNLVVILIFAILINGLAVWSYKKTN